MFYVVTAALEMPMAICHIVTQTIKITLQCAPGHVIVGNWIRASVDAGHSGCWRVSAAQHSQSHFEGSGLSEA